MNGAVGFLTNIPVVKAWQLCCATIFFKINGNTCYFVADCHDGGVQEEEADTLGGLILCSIHWKPF
jgi:hypothetical protein